MNLRLATEQDAPAIAAIYAPFCEASVVSFETAAPTPEDMASRIRTVTAQLPWLVLDDAGTVGGYAYAGRHHERAAYGWAVNAAVYIGEGYRGRGVGRALYTALFDVLRLQGYFKACAGITLPNPASVGLHEAMGFTLVGVYRRHRLQEGRLARRGLVRARAPAGAPRSAGAASDFRLRRHRRLAQNTVQCREHLKCASIKSARPRDRAPRERTAW